MTSLTVKDNGWAYLVKTVQRYRRGMGAHVRVGILGPKAHATHAVPPARKGKGRGKAKAKGPRKHPGRTRSVTVLDVANWNEYGTGRIPPRSFIHASLDGEAARFRVLERELGEQVVRGKITMKRALSLLGLQGVGVITARIARGIPPPNAASTIARKKSSKPLVDTGQLRKSVTYEVHGT